MDDISLHILDVAENSVAAGATSIAIRVSEDTKLNLILVEVEDNGKGIPQEVIRDILDPFYTTRTTRKVGLGLSLLAQSAREAGGDISISSEVNRGTLLRATFEYDHIDRKPLGNLADTFTVLIAGNPDVDFVFIYERNGRSFMFETGPFKESLGGLPINSIPMISEIRQYVTESLDAIAREVG